MRAARSRKGEPIEAGTTEHRLVGRQSERITLRGALDRLAEGPIPAIAISGEPGIGKTALLAELAETAEREGHLSLTGRAAQFERDVPFAVFVDALDGYLASQNPRRLEPLGERHLGELARILPSLADFAEEGGAGQSERYRAHQAVGALLEHLATTRPVLLAIDDVQWADEASLELVAHLLRRAPSGAQLFALAYRPGERPPRLVESVSAAIRDGGLEVVEVGPLSERESAELVPADSDVERLAWLFSESGGNPFYLQQLGRSGKPPGFPARQPTPGREELPTAVVAALEGELAGLDTSARLLIEGAAVAGDPFNLELAAGAAQLPEARSRQALDGLLGRELVQTTEAPQRFRFRHPIVHHTVYASSQAGWRIGAHARARDLLQERGAAPTELAHHVEQAASRGDETAIATLTAAGEAAADLAPGPAADWFGAALRLLPATEQERRPGLLVAMASALAASGRIEKARTALLEALELLPPGGDEERVGLIAFLAAIDHQLGHHDEPRALLTSALDAFADPGSEAALAAQIELAVDGLYASDFETSLHWAGRTAEAATKAGRPLESATAAAIMAISHGGAGRIAEGKPHRVAATEAFDSLSDEDLGAAA